MRRTSFSFAKSHLSSLTSLSFFRSQVISLSQSSALAMSSMTSSQPRSLSFTTMLPKSTLCSLIMVPYTNLYLSFLLLFLFSLSLNSFSDLKPSNVDGVRNVIKFATNKVLKEIHHVSTLSVIIPGSVLSLSLTLPTPIHEEFSLKLCLVCP